MRITERQLKILRLVQKGHSYTEIAGFLGMSRRSVIACLNEFGKNNGFKYSWFVARIHQYDLSAFKPWRCRTGAIGVAFHKPTRKYQARKMVNGIRYNLGLFLFREDAIEAVRRFTPH